MSQPFIPSGGIPQAELLNATTASAASPSTGAATLPGEGLWLVHVQAQLNGSVDHSMSSFWLVHFNDATNDMLAASQLGATAKAAGSSFSLTDLTLSAPTSAGVLTATATWGNGTNYAVRFVIRARQIGSLGA